MSVWRLYARSPAALLGALLVLAVAAMGLAAGNVRAAVAGKGKGKGSKAKTARKVEKMVGEKNAVGKRVDGAVSKKKAGP